MKLIGAGLLLGCGGMWSREMGQKEMAELSRITAFAELFARIREQIALLCLPLDEILATTPSPLWIACGGEGGVTTVASLLPLMTQVADPRAADILTHAAAELGRGSREDQIRLCGATAEALRARREELGAEREKKRRTRGTLVLTACLGGIILLW